MNTRKHQISIVSFEEFDLNKNFDKKKIKQSPINEIIP